MVSLQFFSKYVVILSNYLRYNRTFYSLFLEMAIVDFMKYWRSNWPNESVTPKMHILEDHMVPFVKKWKLGCGFYGEQGAEGIHKEFNEINSNHTSITNPVMRLKSILKRHHLNTFPKALNEELRPKVVTRGPYKTKRTRLDVNYVVD